VRFCIICGKRTDELYNNMCRECYKENTELVRVPEVINITICPECFSYMFRGKWEKAENPYDIHDVVHDAILRNLAPKVKYIARAVKSMDVILDKSIKLVPYKKSKIDVTLLVEGLVDERVGYFMKSYNLKANIRWRLCPLCFKVKAQVEEAILQIRADGRKLDDDEILRIRNLVEEILYQAYEEEGKSPLIKVEEDKKSGGMDLYFASKRIARYIANAIQREFLASIKESYSTVGGNMREERKKITISVRLPKFKVGSIVLYRDRPIIIKDIRDGRIHAMDLRTYEKLKLTAREARDIEICKYRRERAMVLSITGSEIQVMKLTNYEVLDIPIERRPMWIKEGEGVDLITINGKSYIIKGVLGEEE